MSSRPRFLSGLQGFPFLIRFLCSVVRYALQRKAYPGFRLRSVLLLYRTGFIGKGKLVELRGKLHGTTMRPVWPSPAFDVMVANGGMNIHRELIDARRHFDSVMLAITPRCVCRCSHCYEKRNLAERENVAVGRWVAAIQGLQRLGTSVIVLSGGEPMVRYDALLDILRAVDPRRSDAHLHSTGAGVTPQRAEALAGAGLVAAGIGLDYPEAERQDRFRGRHGAFQDAVAAIRAFVDAGVFVYTNVCVRPDNIERDSLLRYLEFVGGLGVGNVQLLEPKPCGGWEGMDPDGLFSAADQTDLAAAVARINSDPRHKEHPVLTFTAPLERPDEFGCLMGGLSHFCIDSAGNVNPCVFVPVSFGNIRTDDIVDCVARMRAAIPAPIRTGCPARLLSKAILVRRSVSGEVRVPYESILNEWEEKLGARENTTGKRSFR